MINYFKNISLKRLVLMILGVAFLGLGVALLNLAGFGTDPFSCMNFGISKQLSLSYGTVQLAVNILLFIPVIILHPKSFGIGAIVNMIGVGYIVDFTLWICEGMGVTTVSVAGLMWARVLLMVSGVIVICFGIALYMECDLGAAPYDIIAQIVEDKTHGKMKFRWARVILDILAVSAGYMLGGIVGLATVITAFFTGPIISFFRAHAVKKLLT